MQKKIEELEQKILTLEKEAVYSPQNLHVEKQTPLLENNNNYTNECKNSKPYCDNDFRIYGRIFFE